jgi:hypothetical protein
MQLRVRCLSDETFQLQALPRLISELEGWRRNRSGSVLKFYTAIYLEVLKRTKVPQSL